MKNSTKGLIKAPNSLTNRFNKIQRRIIGACASLVTATATVLPVSAATVNTDMTTEEMLGGIIEFICNVARYMGIVVVAAGIFMLIFAYKDDNAEAQSRAVRFAVIGAIMLSLKTVLKLTGLIS